VKKIIVFLFISVFVWAEHNYSNALIDESSPYLQQHAHNPVQWYPWGKEALEKAKKENKLIFLSIGYSTCHWCHVMEEESFTDIEIAKLLNDDFVSIKVDREEYPQIDKKYQSLYMDVRGKRGGWPLSVFLTPQEEVIFLGTYIPKYAGYGSKGLTNLLSSFVHLKKDRAAFQEVIDKHKKSAGLKRLKAKPDNKIMDSVVDAIEKQFDSVNGGFASRPKFPEASKLELLLDIYKLNKNKKAFDMAETTLTKMAEGGIYDQIGGGFFRYTTDYEWQQPHFEKMLYTNGELTSVYVKAYLMTGNKLFKKVVDETIVQMEKNYMQEGVYLSASDADSDGEEGGYFIYEYVEVKEALKEKGWTLKEIDDGLAYLGIEEDGNMDGDFSHTHITTKYEPPRLEELKKYLASVSAKRTFPFVDKKINTAWNSMMIKALFTASQIDTNYLILAEKRLDTLLEKMYQKEILYHQTLLGHASTQKALLEDYAFLIDTLIVAYSRTYKKKYLLLSHTLTDEVLTSFYRNKHWYLSNDGIEAYADFDDRYYSASLSVVLENLLRISSLTDELKYTAVVKETIDNMGAVLQTNPADASKLVHVYLRLTLGDIIIHAKKEKLLIAQKALDEIVYPFVLSGVQDSDEYLACKTTMCFAHDANITRLINTINKAVK